MTHRADNSNNVSLTSERTSDSAPNRAKGLLKLGAVLTIGASALAGCSPSSEAAPFPTPTQSVEAEEPEVEKPVENLGNYLIPLDQLEKMSDAEITEAASVKVEDVIGADGKIDWSLVPSKIIDSYELALATGTTSSIAETTLNEGISTEESASTNSRPVIDALFTESGWVMAQSGFESSHTANVLGAELSYLRDGDPIIVDLEDGNHLIIGSDENTATIAIDLTYKVNLFSSGAFDANDARDVEKLGGATEDVNAFNTRTYGFVVENGVIKIASVA